MWILYVLLFLFGLGAFGTGSVGGYIGYIESDLRFAAFGAALAIVGVLMLIVTVIGAATRRLHQPVERPQSGAAMVVVLGLSIGLLIFVGVTIYALANAYSFGVLIGLGGAFLFLDLIRRYVDGIVPAEQASTPRRTGRTVRTHGDVVTQLSKDETFLLVVMRKLYKAGRLKIVVERESENVTYTAILDGERIGGRAQPAQPNAS